MRSFVAMMDTYTRMLKTYPTGGADERGI
jgi:hypothetical protein